MGLVMAEREMKANIIQSFEKSPTLPEHASANEPRSTETPSDSEQEKATAERPETNSGEGGSLEEGGFGETRDSEPERTDIEQSETTTQTEILLALSESAELFHTADKTAYAAVPVGGHLQTCSVDSEEFRLWLVERFYRESGRAPSEKVVRTVVDTVKARALFDSPEESVHVRVAEKLGSTYLDLANEQFEAVEITRDGWAVVTDAPVRFVRPRGMMPLPRPESGGSIDELRSVINVRDEDFPLVVAWLIGALRPSGPYPVLVLVGQQGSAKTTATRILRSLIDPTQAVARALPKNEQDLAIAARNNWVLTFDNLSSLPRQLSDALCRVSTGGALATRKLYTDDVEQVLLVSNPVLLNGITNFVTRGDLLDRALVVELPSVRSHERRDLAVVNADFERVGPRVLGQLLDAVVSGLRDVESVELSEAPRMAGFARFAAAAVPAFGWSPNDFLRAYATNRDDAVEISIESSLVGFALLELRNHEPDWEGSATELLKRLVEVASADAVKSDDWPKDATRLGSELRRLEPALEKRGLHLERRKSSDGQKRLIRLSWRMPVDAAGQTAMSIASEAKPSAIQQVSEVRTLSDAVSLFSEEEKEREKGRRGKEERDEVLASAPSAVSVVGQAIEQWDGGSPDLGIDSGGRSEQLRNPGETSEVRGAASGKLAGSETPRVPPETSSHRPTLGQVAANTGDIVGGVVSPDEGPSSHAVSFQPKAPWYPPPLTPNEVLPMMLGSHKDSLLERVEAELLERVELEPDYLTSEQSAAQLHCLAALSIRRAALQPLGRMCSLSSHLEVAS